jgi:NTP pyrophosphatase (non-canonical NTP hydrolase)
MKLTEEKIKEILLITQEECAEIIQAISKSFRFGVHTVYNGVSNKEHLEEEIGDFLCMLDLLIDNGIVNEDAVISAKNQKLNKLLTWSNIFKK